MQNTLANLESILEENYTFINPKNGGLKVVQNFIDQFETVCDLPIDLIKKLTKVAEHMVNEGYSIDLNKLIVFNEEGSDISRKLLASETNPGEIRKLKIYESHFLGHAGNIYEIAYRENHDPFFLEESIRHRINSAELSLRIEDIPGSVKSREYSARSFRIASELIKELSELNQETSFDHLVKYYTLTHKSAKLFLSLGKTSLSGFLYSNLLNVIENIHGITGDDNWLKKGYVSSLLSANNSLNNVARRFYSLNKARNISYELYTKTKNVFWYKKWVDSCNECFSLYDSFDFNLRRENSSFIAAQFEDLLKTEVWTKELIEDAYDHRKRIEGFLDEESEEYYYNKGFLGTYAKNLATVIKREKGSKDDRIKWLEIAYDALYDAAIHLKTNNYSHSAYLFGHAGDVTKFLSKDTNDQDYYMISYYCYTQFLEFFEKGDSEILSRNSRLVRRIRSGVDFLEKVVMHKRYDHHSSNNHKKNHNKRSLRKFKHL